MKLGGIDCHIFTSTDPTFFTTKAVQEAEKRVPSSISKAEELASNIEDDVASCYIEVPATANSKTVPIYYAIFYRIHDLTYTHEIKAEVDGGRVPEIVVVHSGGRATPAPLKTNTGLITGVSLTNDWSKSRGLKFESTGHTTTEGGRPKSRMVLDEQETNGLGEVKISFFRAQNSKEKSKSTGFHKDAPVTSTDPDKVPLGISHKTGLGPILFGPPRKTPAVEQTDTVPFVTFVFKYRSKDFLPEDWLLTSIPTAEEVPPMSPLQAPAAGEERPSTLMMKRSSSLAVKAGKWTGALKDGLKDVHIPGNKKKLSKTPEEGTTTDAPPKTPPKETSEAEATANTDSATQPAPA